jgi:hypothetical protein
MYTFDRGVDLPPRAREKGRYVFTGTTSLRIGAEEKEDEEEESAREREAEEAEGGVVAADTDTDAVSRFSPRKSFVVLVLVRRSRKSEAYVRGSRLRFFPTLLSRRWC